MQATTIATMREQERTLNQDIERCINMLQEIVDTETSKSISIFGNKTTENERWLEEITDKFKLKDDSELQEIYELRGKHLNDLNAIEEKIEYYEKLCDEIEEFQNEMEVKKKLAQNRQSRTNHR